MGFKTDAENSFISLLMKERPDILDSLKNVAPGALSFHGTTVLSIKFSGGIVAAGDKRSVSGYDLGPDIEKVYEIDNDCALCIAGSAGPAIELVKILSVESDFFRRKNSFHLPIEGKREAVSRILKPYFYQMASSPMSQPIIVSPLLVVYDAKMDKGRIFIFDVTGTSFEVKKDFCANGSGKDKAETTIGSEYRPDLSREDAIAIAREAIRSASVDNFATGPDASVIVITSAGVERIEN